MEKSSCCFCYRKGKNQKKQFRRFFKYSVYWENSDEIIEKIEEEIAEIRSAINKDGVKENLSGEIGDLIFSCINLARYYQIDSEVALQMTNKKFIKRFNYIEDSLKKKGKLITETNLEEMDKLWDEAKINII